MKHVANTVNGHFSAVTIFSRFSRLASSPRKYHDRNLEQVIDVIEQNRNFLVVWALQPRKYQSAKKRLPQKNGRIQYFCFCFGFDQSSISSNHVMCDVYLVSPISPMDRAQTGNFFIA